MVRGAIHRAVDSPHQGLVVRPRHKLAPLKMVTEVVDGEVEGKELLVENAVLDLGVGELLRKESKRASNPTFFLGEDCAHSNGGGVRGQGETRGWIFQRMSQKHVAGKARWHP